MKILMLTTSYPPFGGSFVASSVDAARARGLAVEVVSPTAFTHFGIAGGHGIVANLRARPWLALLVPVFLWNFRRAASRAGAADLVHAHWLVSGVVAASLRRPYVVQLWGTDAELARRVPRLVRPLLRHVIAASPFLAAEARALGARVVHVVPTAVAIPDLSERSDDGSVLFAGRLSPEKGIEEFLAATEGLARIVVGAGPIAVPEGVGEVPQEELGRYYDRAAVVVVPSRREGYGMVAREAMAHGCAVVASAVGGLRDAIDDGLDGVLVPPRDVVALRAAIERLLHDPALRAQLGAAAREKAQREWSLDAAADAYVRAIT